MAKEYTDILTPVGRLVSGSAYSPRVQKTDDPTATPRESYDLGIAIPKAGEAHWNQTEWGAKIWAAGLTGYAAQTGAPTFSWKITDGDSLVPNKANKVPAEQEGYAGNWVVFFSSIDTPRVVDKHGVKEITEKDAVKLGYFIQIFGSVTDNRTAAGLPAKSPGVYLNPKIVALSAYGPEIKTAAHIDAKTVGFGVAALPAGALATPVGGMSAPAPAAQVVPNHNFAAAQVAPPPPARAMTAAATTTYEEYIKAGWTDDMLRLSGFMI